MRMRNYRLAKGKKSRVKPRRFQFLQRMWFVVLSKCLILKENYQTIFVSNSDEYKWISNHLSYSKVKKKKKRIGGKTIERLEKPSKRIQDSWAVLRWRDTPRDPQKSWRIRFLIADAWRICLIGKNDRNKIATIWWDLFYFLFFLHIFFLSFLAFKAIPWERCTKA